jgi:hypothetical protein
MEWNTLKEFDKSVEEPFEEKPDIKVNIVLDESLLEDLKQLFDETREETPEKHVVETKEEQEEVNKIWNQIGSRIP